METFWATVAQTLPVIVFAVSVEVRAIAKGWPEWSWIQRAVQGLLWAIFYGASGIVELLAFEVLAGMHAPGWLRAVSINTIAYGIGVLFLSPTLELLSRSLLPQLVALRWYSPRTAWRILKLERTIKQTETEYRRAVEVTLPLEEEGRARRDKAIKQLAYNQEGMRRISIALQDPTLPGDRRKEYETYLADSLRWREEEAAWVRRFDSHLANRPDVEGMAAELLRMRAELAGIKSTQGRMMYAARNVVDARLQGRIPAGSPLLPAVAPPTEPINSTGDTVPQAADSASQGPQGPQTNQDGADSGSS